MNVEIIMLGVPVMTGPQRIAWRFAAERARVESFNRHMTEANMNYRTALWKGLI